MNFLRKLLGRPEHEHAMLLMPIGYPADDAKVPDLTRKSLNEVSSFFEWSSFFLSESIFVWALDSYVWLPGRNLRVYRYKNFSIEWRLIEKIYRL